MPGKQAFPKTKSHRFFGHPLRVGFYARVSTHDQQTLPLQLHAMRDYAAKRGWTIAAQIKEVGRDILRERVRAGLAHARLNGKRLGRPPTVVHKAIETRNLYRQGIGKSEIARRLRIGRTSVRRLLAQKKS
jgi:DNA invertase Pin-like site-specific DNA recombinase